MWGRPETPDGRKQKPREVALLSRTSYLLKATAEHFKNQNRTEPPGKTRQMVRAPRASATPESTPPLPLGFLLVPGLDACARWRARAQNSNAGGPALGCRYALRWLSSYLSLAAKAGRGCATFPALSTDTVSPCHLRMLVFRTAWRRSMTHVRHPFVLCPGAQALSYTCSQMSQTFRALLQKGRRVFPSL